MNEETDWSDELALLADNMKIRDSFATINGDSNIIEMPSNGLEIVADDGRTLFRINLNKDGSIDVDTGMLCKHSGKLLDTGMTIRPRATNIVKIERPEYSS